MIDRLNQPSRENSPAVTRTMKRIDIGLDALVIVLTSPLWIILALGVGFCYVLGWLVERSALALVVPYTKWKDRIMQRRREESMRIRVR